MFGLVKNFHSLLTFLKLSVMHGKINSPLCGFFFKSDFKLEDEILKNLLGKTLLKCCFPLLCTCSSNLPASLWITNCSLMDSLTFYFALL